MTAPLVEPQAASGLAPVAALAMYDPPRSQWANDALWRAIAERLSQAGIDAPGELTRDRDLDTVWRDPNLLLAQTCGYPLTAGLKNAVRLVATPRYLAPGCSGAFHCSAIVVRAASGVRDLGALRGARCAINDRRSNTGMNLLRAAIAPLARGRRFFGEVQVTGSHAASLAAVAGGEADVAAIDTVTLALLRRDQPELTAGVRTIGSTRVTPGLPLITSVATPDQGLLALRGALEAVARDPQLAGVRAALLLDGFTVLPAGLYDQIPYLEQDAAARGYPELA